MRYLRCQGMDKYFVLRYLQPRGQEGFDGGKNRTRINSGLGFDSRLLHR